MEREYEILGKVFLSQFPGVCRVDPDHKIRRGDKVARVQYADNPMIPVTGVACSQCLILLPKA